ncbi:MAG: hypothetical protein IIB66_11250 [Proteobacteria bacterium]|nr:hypothetical protein [Pseudomonadota bacterium]
MVQGTNIHEETLLATDYLNHLNEIIMLLGMIPSMPECLEDAHAWEPKTYVQHFRDSSFADKDLAVFAYENAPERYRLPFESTIAHINDLAAEGIADIEKVLETGEQGRIDDTVATISRNMQKFIDVASAIIHGDVRTMDQAEIDGIMTN